MEFFIFDIIFLVVFSLGVFIFLYPRRKKVDREGIIFLYRTKFGIKLINYFGNKYKKILDILSYFIIFIGYLLMIASFYFLIKIFFVFISIPEVRVVPPLLPLIPYLPKLFNLTFLPPFYFTYWIIALAITAAFHEFSHGIISERNKIGIKSTGFGFLGPFLLAFVEPDEKSMQRKSKFSQLSVACAGSFANLVLFIFFLGIAVAFFSLVFFPAGSIINNYVYTKVNLTNVNSIGGYNVTRMEDIKEAINKQDIINKQIKSGILNLTLVEVNNETYYAEISVINNSINKNLTSVFLYENYPAINVGIFGVIIEINGLKIKKSKDLSNELSKYKPGDIIDIKTEYKTKIESYSIVLSKNPKNESRAYLGISGFESRAGILSRIFEVITRLKDPGTYYKSRINENVAIFISDLFWWIVIINFSVAIMNMLPVGIFDGGRVFYLTMLKLTGSKKMAKKLFIIMTYIILLTFLSLMVLWFVL